MRLLFATLLVLASGHLFGQKTIYGIVIDSLSREPLQFSHVYVNNSTMGTSTDSSGSYSLNVTASKLEVVFSFIGYRTRRIAVNLHNDSLRVDVVLQPEVNVLEAVTVSADADRRWKKLAAEFKGILLGKTRLAKYCEILNSEYVDLVEVGHGRSRVLSASCSRAIEVRNDALGYKIFYDLRSFNSTRAYDRFDGNIFFVQLETDDPEKHALWEKNRRAVYRGSVRHLFRSVLTRSAAQESFRIGKYDSISGGPIEIVLAVISSDPNAGSFRIPMPRETYVLYEMSGRKMFSKLFASAGFVEVDSMGVVLNPSDLVVSGDLGAARISTFLPDDFDPGAGAIQPIFIDSPHPLSDTNAIFDVSRGGVYPTSQFDFKLNAVHAKFFLETNAPETVYAQFDKPFYLSGEDSWYTISVVRSSTLHSTDISSVLYVDWSDPSGTLLAHQKLKIIDGKARAQFRIPVGHPEGVYTVTTYTNWMRNEDPLLFHRTKIPVYDPSKAFDTSVLKNKSPGAAEKPEIKLKFFPEGGTLIANLQTQIAFKAVDRNGNSVNVRAKIYDETGGPVGEIVSAHNGMGAFPLLSRADQSFHVVLDGGEVFKVPRALDEGVSLSASSVNDRLLLRVQTLSHIDSSFNIVGICRGDVVFAEAIVANQSLTELVIERNALPAGVIRFLLFARNGSALCERMIFIREQNPITVLMAPETETMSGDSVVMTLRVRDKSENPIQMPLSVSVVDARILEPTSASGDMNSHMLLESEFNFAVENPRWYFEAVTPERNHGLDLLMLTGGWSRYQWKNAILSPVKPKFDAETQLQVSGRIQNGKKTVGIVPFSVIIPQSSTNPLSFGATDKNGNFHVGGLDFYDSTKSYWNLVRSRPLRKPSVSIEDYVADPGNNLAGGRNFLAEKQAILERIVSVYGTTDLGIRKDFMMLDEVEIEAKRIVAQSNGRGGVIVRPSKENKSMTTGQFVGQYANGLALQQPSLSSEGQQVWKSKVSIDGAMATNVGPAGDPIIILNSIPIGTVRAVEIYGSARAGYVIQLATGEDLSRPRSVIEKTIYGYTPAQDFSEFQLARDSSSHDRRSTLYWNPDARSLADGSVTVKFRNSESTSQVLIVVEGVYDGKIVSQSEWVTLD